MLSLTRLAVDHGKLRALWDVSMHVGHPAASSSMAHRCSAPPPRKPSAAASHWFRKDGGCFPA